MKTQTACYSAVQIYNVMVWSLATGVPNPRATHWTGMGTTQQEVSKPTKLHRAPHRSRYRLSSIPHLTLLSHLL